MSCASDLTPPRKEARSARHRAFSFCVAFIFPEELPNTKCQLLCCVLESLFYFKLCVCVWVGSIHESAVPAEARGQHQIPRRRSYGRSWATQTRVLRSELWSSRRAVRTLNYWGIFLAPLCVPFGFLCDSLIYNMCSFSFHEWANRNEEQMILRRNMNT